MTREELVCIYWSSGGSQKDAEKKADKSIQEGDENGNGVIDGDGMYKYIITSVRFHITWKLKLKLTLKLYGHFLVFAFFN